MTHEIVSVLCGGIGPELPTNSPIFRFVDNRENKISPCAAYQKLLETSDKDVLVYIHDDVTIHDDNWLKRVLHFFCPCGCHCNTTMPYMTPCLHCTPKGCAGMRFGETGQVVAVGLGGATGLGNRDLYRKSWNIWNMARTGYASNQTDAEVHGERFTGTRRVAVLDAFVLAVRTEWLRQRGGWPVEHLTFHCLDLWLACEAARCQKETWMVGISATHHGGGSSISPKYKDARWLKGGSREQDHILPHIWLASEYRDVLPIEVTT